MPKRYVVITPARNEERTIEHTVRSLIAQDVRPEKWVVVDDGSSDQTAAIVERYMADHDWIDLLKVADRGYRELGPGVVRAFNLGLERIGDQPWDFVVKLDADLSFQPNYFANLLRRFEDNPKLGIASGKTFLLEGDQKKLEWCHDDHVRGPAKMYFKPCYDEIGGIESIRGWDVIDEVTAQMKGWDTRSFLEEEIIHHRPIDGRQSNVLRSRFEMGMLYNRLGYDFPYLVVRSVRSALLDYPRVLGGTLLLVGYLYSLLKGEPRQSDAFVATLRKKQRERFSFAHFRKYLSSVSRS